MDRFDMMQHEMHEIREQKFQSSVPKTNGSNNGSSRDAGNFGSCDKIAQEMKRGVEK
jgi:hypothetical protein